jgi:hypothetical protein
LTLVFNSANELDKYEDKYELEPEPENETAKNEKKKNTTITAQAAVTTINAILPMAAPPAAGRFFAVADFVGALFTAVPHEAQNFSPCFKGFPHFEQLAMISLLTVLRYQLPFLL